MTRRSSIPLAIATLLSLTLYAPALAQEVKWYEDCEPSPYFGQPCQPPPVPPYEANGNRICGHQEWLARQDFDSDGNPDCYDPDDENDGLSDQVEDFYYGASASYTMDSDADGITDGFDMKPRTAFGPIAITLKVAEYDNLNSTCDVDFDWNDPVYLADPFFSALVVDAIPGGSKTLIIPGGWSEEKHVDNRPSDPVVGDGDLEPLALAAEIDLWPIGPGTIPRPRLTAGLVDHDLKENDAIDIGHGTWEHYLTSDTALTYASLGSGDCSALLRIQFVDDALAPHVKAAAANWAQGTPVTMYDVQ